MQVDTHETSGTATLPPPPALESLPTGELVTLAADLGLPAEPNTSREDLVRSIRCRRELLARLDAQTLVEIVTWAGKPPASTTDRIALVRQVASLRKWTYHRLSHKALVALALLRDLPVQPSDPAEAIVAALHKQGSLRERLRKKRREWMASLIGKVLGNRPAPASPPAAADRPAEPARDRQNQLEAEIVERGVVRGLASTLRGVTDDYIREKLDEIEARIDRKLGEIDRRLQEWRDREIANRLRILKITLAASLIVAALSFGYNWLKYRVTRTGGPEASPVLVSPPATPPAQR